MAAGETLVSFGALHNEPPSAVYATLDIRNNRPILDFDKDTDESAIFSAVMPQNYSGGSIDVILTWMTTVTTNSVVWDVDFERSQEDTDDLDSDHFTLSPQSVTAAAPATSGHIDKAIVAFTSGEVDGIVAGEYFRLKVTRDADNGSDLVDADAELLSVEIRES